MDERTKKDIIDTLYDKVLEVPKKIEGILSDFFGEENVDLQTCDDIITYIHYLIDCVEISSYINSIPKGICKNSTLNACPEDKISVLLDKVNIDYIISRLTNSSPVYLMIHFPTVRVTNEYNEYVDITHLFVRLKLNLKGLLIGYFTMNRSEYTYIQFISDYMHSHIPGIPTYDFRDFKSPCLGSGPIRDTCSTLNMECNYDIWELFCVELKKYVSVESLEGVPYRKLNNIGEKDKISVINNFIHTETANLNISYRHFTILTTFTQHLIYKRILQFNFINGKFSLGTSFLDTIITVSNVFIEWYNSKYRNGEVKASFNDLLTSDFIERAVIENNKLSYINTSSSNHRDSIESINNYIGSRVCKFKGKDITLNITDIHEESNDNTIIVLNTRILSCILTNILKVLNYRYGNTEEHNVGKAVLYI